MVWENCLRHLDTIASVSMPFIRHWHGDLLIKLLSLQAKSSDPPPPHLYIFDSIPKNTLLQFTQWAWSTQDQKCPVTFCANEHSAHLSESIWPHHNMSWHVIKCHHVKFNFFFMTLDEIWMVALDFHEKPWKMVQINIAMLRESSCSWKFAG